MIPLLRADDVREIDAYNARLGMPCEVLMQNFAFAVGEEFVRGNKVLYSVRPGQQRR